MANSTTIIGNGSSVFRLGRPQFTMGGFITEVDPTVGGLLDELDQMLGMRIFSPPGPGAYGPTATGSPSAGLGDLGEELGGLADDGNEFNVSPEDFGDNPGYATAPGWTPDIVQLMSLPLTPKHIHVIRTGKPAGRSGSGTPNSYWQQGSLLDDLVGQIDDPTKNSLADYIDLTVNLSRLKYEFQSNYPTLKSNLPYNITAVLDGHSAILDYLIVYAYQILNVQDTDALSNFVFNNRQGATSIINYAAISAVRAVTQQKQLNVPGFDDKDDNTSPFVQRVLSAGLPFSSASFETAAEALIDDYVFNAQWAQILAKAKIGTIPPALQPQLIKLIKASPIPITDKNIDYFLPQYISQLAGPTIDTTTDGTDTTTSDQDFDVTFFQDDTSLVQISQSAVKCAAQLFYDKVVGDELDVFSVITYFTHKYLVRGSIEIQDGQLRDDLQTYVFSNRFTDLKNSRVVDRTRPAERHMFYRQVFNNGSGQVTTDVIVNEEFPRLWKVLMLESARYIEALQMSPKPDSYVSPQNVQQAVEDLQYNLSTHCTGMANVISPLIYAELDFVIRRILMHDEIRRQIVPAGGTWWRVVEALYMEMKNARPRSTVIYNKAVYGYEILRAIADYTPAAFADETTFSNFMSTVDAFITTQSILQEALTEDLKHGDDTTPQTNGAVKALPAPTEKPPAGPTPEHDEWDF